MLGDAAGKNNTYALTHKGLRVHELVVVAENGLGAGEKLIYPTPDDATGKNT